MLPHTFYTPFNSTKVAQNFIDLAGSNKPYQAWKRFFFPSGNDFLSSSEIDKCLQVTNLVNRIYFSIRNIQHCNGKRKARITFTFELFGMTCCYWFLKPI